MFHHAHFVKSCSDWRQWPEHSSPVPIVGFWGRSNVGKSSLLNALLGEKIAHVSNTPGRTQLLNLFFHPARKERGPDCLFCDLPGYGYANVSKKDANLISGRLYDYLENSPYSPNMLIWLLDARHGCTSTDFSVVPLIAALAEKAEICVISTKNDKISRTQQLKNKAQLEKQLRLVGINSEVLLWSTLHNKQELLMAIEQKINHFCSNFQPTNKLS